MALALTTVSCGSAARSVSDVTEAHSCSVGTRDPRALTVNLGDLFDDPQKFAGKRVRVRAFIVNEKEDQGLYETSDDAMKPRPLDRLMTGCAGRLPVPPPMRALWWDAGDARVECNRQNVIVEGKFDPCEPGHMSIYAGGIRDVVFVESVSRNR